MLDFLKHEPEDDYEFDDEYDELMDEEDPDEDDDLDEEPVKTKPLFSFFGDKNKKNKEEDFDEEDEIVNYTEKELNMVSADGRIRSRFSTDYYSALQNQVQAARDNLARRTEEAYELVRQTAGQPASSAVHADAEI